jgi:hypothetical protein
MELKQDGVLWTGFICLMIGNTEGSCDYVTEVISETFMAAEVGKISVCQPCQLKFTDVSGAISALIIFNQLTL